MELAKIEYIDHGLAIEHSMPCAVCGKKKAVYHTNDGNFLPCWSCQSKGWVTVKVQGWRRRLLKWLGLLHR